MVAVDNPWSITYGSRTVGGASDTYQLHAGIGGAPMRLSRSFETITVEFDVMVVGESYSNLKSLASDLETDFRKRDQNLTISMDGNDFTFTSGTTFLNSRATITKAGDPDTDKGTSRLYTCLIEGELPADDASPTVTGLRDVRWTVTPTPSRQKIVTMEGVYTATETPAQLASVNYLHANGADSEASTFLTALDSGATFELTNENYTPDRNDHLCSFQREYTELLFNQAAGTLDDTDIRDHTVTFRQLLNHPGDSVPDIRRLRRVVGIYECGVDIDQSTDLVAAFDNKIKGHVKAVFETNFTPTVFCIEDRQVSYDETSKRLNAAITFLYQAADSEAVVEVTSSLAIRELRTVDYTPLHDNNEYSFAVDIGWATREKVSTRTVMVVGEEAPKRRIGDTPEDGPAGDMREALPAEELSGGGGRLSAGRRVGAGVGVGPPLSGGRPVVGGVGGGASGGGGWQTIQNESDVTYQWIGDPDDEQIQVSILNELVVERWSSGGGGVGRLSRFSFPGS